MKLKKIVETLGNIGTLIFLIYFITSLVLYKTLYGFENDGPVTICIDTKNKE